MGRHGALHWISLDCIAFRLIHRIALHCIRHYISLYLFGERHLMVMVLMICWRRYRAVLIGRLARAAGLAESDSGGGNPGHCASDISDMYVHMYLQTPYLGQQQQESSGIERARTFLRN